MMFKVAQVIFLPSVKGENEIKASMKNIITTKMTCFILGKNSNGGNFLYTILHPFLDGLFWSGF